MEWVLVIHLMQGVDPVVMPVHDCRAMAEWVREARLWAKRSGLPQTERVGCYRIDDPKLLWVAR